MIYTYELGKVDSSRKYDQVDQVLSEYGYKLWISSNNLEVKTNKYGNYQKPQRINKTRKYEKYSHHKYFGELLGCYSPVRSFDFDDRLPPIIVLTTMLQKRLFDKSWR